jgi:hypothetical protein
MSRATNSIWVTDRFTDIGRVRDVTFLFIAGVAATTLVACVPTPIRVPGHAILKAALPLACGLAFVGRPWSGTIAAVSALATAALFLVLGIGHLQTAALVSLLALGPAMDWSRRSDAKGHDLLLRFAFAGLMANMLAFVTRWGVAWLSTDGWHPLNFQHVAYGAFCSFALCGLAAGLLCAVFCYRSSEKLP